MRDALEFFDRAAVVCDRRLVVAPAKLDQAEIDQAAADLLDVAHLLRDRQPSAQSIDRLVVLSSREVRIAE